ncbi:MAG TPA: UPF0182 family protein [Actinomycetota bacterium]|nr:UPF0182 family protein [Actinomycetota bacterium]
MSPPGARRGRSFVIAILFVAVFGTLASVRFYTDILWFREVGFSSVLFTSLSTQFMVGAAVGLAVGILVWLNLVIAGRGAPAYRLGRIGGAPDPVERYREVLTPHLRWVRVGVGALMGLVAGLGAASMWQTYLLWANRVPFGVRDPQFGRDVGFFVFELPFYDALLDWAWFALGAALLVSAAAHYFHGAIRPENRLSGVTPAALAHVSVLLGLLALVKAVQYYLGGFELVFSPRGTVTGASYTDVTAQLPALRLLAIISVLSALLFLVNIWVRRAVLPLAAIGIWVLTAILAGAAWPWWVQRFSVDPQELQRERPYIKRNIEATQAGFDLDDVTVVDFAASRDLEGEDVRRNEGLLANVRLWDPDVLAQAYRQLQALRTYYRFVDVDIDRYEIDGETRQVMLSARELSLEGLPPGSQTWSNRHLQYTHGYGIVASLSKAATTAGQPDFLVQNVPGQVEAGAEALDPDEQPRIYYGESFAGDDYSIVNTGQDELDYPGARSNYEGEGGIEIGRLLRRLAFTVRELDPNILLSDLIEADSRILLYRNVRDRVMRAAPFLSLDHDPYPAVVDGRILWILDGYTKTDMYPYAQRFPLRDLVDSDQPGTLRGEANYVRNSVKVVVDAYDGSMDFYVIDEEDPLIQAWRNAFPELFTDEEPSDELRAHFRYPEDLFNIQSEVYLTYHMDSPDDFYAREDAWAIPRAPGTNGSDSSATMPGVYLLVSLPGDADQEFVLARPFTPRARNVMISFLLAQSDPERYGELELLRFPSSNPPLGPSQIDNLINQDVEISQTLTLLRQGGSDVQFGSLIVVPIEDSLIYVMPLFVTAEGNGEGTQGIPELKRVVVVHGEEVEFRPTFDEALAAIFDLEEGETPPPPDEGDGEEEPDDPAPPTGRLAEIVAEASQVYERAQEALADGDFERYGRLITRLGQLLEEAQSLSGR